MSGRKRFKRYRKNGAPAGVSVGALRSETRSRRPDAFVVPPGLFDQEYVPVITPVRYVRDASISISCRGPWISLSIVIGP